MKLLTNGEIHAILTKYAYDVRYKGTYHFTKIAELCDIHVVTLNSILARGWIQEKHRLRISSVLQSIERGEVEFTKDEVRYTDAPRLSPQGKILRLDEWREFAPCSSCGRSKWATVFIRGEVIKEMRVCDNCIPPDQYRFLHLDTNGNRDYKRLTEKESDIGDHPGISLQRLRKRIRVNAERRGGGLPSMLKRRGREGV